MTATQKPEEFLPLSSEAPPLRIDEGGAVRVGTSRVCLDLVIEVFQQGMTPEAIVEAYDTLKLKDVYAAIAYYLRHQEAVDEYLKRRQAEAERLRAEIESKRPPISREALLARRIARESGHATNGQ